MRTKINAQKHFEYPFPEGSKDIWNLGLKIKLKRSIDQLLPKSHKNRDTNVKIWQCRSQKSHPLSEKDFPLIFVIHNGRRFLPSFLAHYRNLGVSRFLCIDDKSNDGSTEYLLQQSDVDLHFSNVRYKDAARSKTWRELLAKKYGKNRWYLNVDIDEYLFTGCNSKMTISEYANILYSKRIYRLPAPMIDMVPNGNLEDVILNDKIKPWEICAYFDSDNYSGHATSGGIKLYGGARKRLWNAQAELMKYPLIYWDSHTSMGVSIHSPRPSYRNYAPVCGALLHFKIFSDSKKIAQEALTSGQYFDSGREYKLMHKYFQEHSNHKLVGKNSIYFKNEETLVKCGMIKPF